MFHVPPDQELIERVVEAIFQAHVYEEPMITVRSVVLSQSRGLNDKANPNRWWNRGGDWLEKPNPASS